MSAGYFYMNIEQIKADKALLNYMIILRVHVYF